ncbi:LPS export ABC transporter permease LptG [Shimia marina]|uniref:Lipopolysaccharide export system permease protein LptG n=1 Tax=Shimia marina TaxID=321267 RepID=A0A0P1FER5_9RHOB|nr:LPS export ABC transporter permease LptG [Shimia marina]CUH53610.1 Lipopolysaccharide export system permease protein LptG [Shimia marina]SFD72951.1 lipopolysaccharide export system permease protein [Shimia marina]
MTVHFYFARKFVWIFLGIVAVFFILTVLVDMMEQLRRYDVNEVGFAKVVALTLLRTPESIYQLLPLIVILATIALFIALSRSSELVVVRAAGRSGIISVLSPAIMTLIIGVVAITMFNPIVASTSVQYQVQSDALRSNGSNALSFSKEGIWLRQGGSTGHAVIHAARTNADATEFVDLSIIAYSENNGPERRIEAVSARLIEDGWELSNAQVWDLNGGISQSADASFHETLLVGSSLTPDRIRDRFGTPSSVPIWQLPGFIRELNDAGFSARRHTVWLHMELAQPLFLMAMVLIASAFTMRHTRFGNTGIAVLTAVLIGFSLYFVRNFAQILGENGQIPVLLAAWAPPTASVMLALGLLLHMEDG